MGGTRVKKSAKRFAKQLPAVIKGRKRRQQVLRNKEKRESRREASVREESFRDAQQETEKEAQEAGYALTRIPAKQRHTQKEGPSKVQSFLEGFDQAVDEASDLSDTLEEQDGDDSGEEQSMSASDEDYSEDEDEVEDEDEDEDEDVDALVSKYGDSKVKSKAEKAKNLRKDAEQEKVNLEKLKREQPEFYAFLQDHDQELLEMTQADAPEPMSEEDEEDEKDEKSPGIQAANEEVDVSKLGEESQVLTNAMIKGWVRSLQEAKSLRAAKKMLLGFQCAVSFSKPTITKEQRQRREAGSGAAMEEDEAPPAFIVPSGAVYDRIVMSTLSSIPAFFDSYLGRRPDVDLPVENVRGNSLSLSVELPSKNKRWPKIKVYVKNFLSSVLSLLGYLTAPDMIHVVLEHLIPAIPYMEPFKPLAKKILKFLLGSFRVEDDAVRLTAFLNVRKMALTLSSEFMDLCLKSTYLTFVRNAKFVSFKTFSTIVFMSNCVAELYSLDLNASYQHAFVYIRQLAVTLRDALNKTSRDVFRSVYNWQFINSLRVWTQVVSTVPGDQELGPLVFPLVQVMLGVIKLSPNTRFFPLRFHCCRFLAQLERSANVYVPLSPLLLEVFHCAELKKTAQNSGGGSVDFLCSLKLPAQALKTKKFQDDVVDEALEILAQHFATHSTSISFPELVAPAVFQLKIFVRTTRVLAAKKKVLQFLDKVEASVNTVLAQRKKVDYSPRDLSKVARFAAEYIHGKTPMQQYADELHNSRDAERQQRLVAKLDLGLEEPGVKGRASGSQRGPKLDQRDRRRSRDGEEEDKDGAQDVSQPQVKRAKLPVRAKDGRRPANARKSRMEADVVEPLELSDSD